MAQLNVIKCPRFSIDYVFDAVAKTVSGLAVDNSAGTKPLNCGVIVSGAGRQITVAPGASQTLTFSSAVAYTEPDLAGVGKPGQIGFRMATLTQMWARQS